MTHGPTSVHTRHRRGRICCTGSGNQMPDKDYSHRTRLQKLGVKPDWRVSVVSVGDPDFIEELRGAVRRVSIGRVLDESDAIFFGAIDARQLARLATLKRSMKANGALWVIR